MAGFCLQSCLQRRLALWHTQEHYVRSDSCFLMLIQGSHGTSCIAYLSGVQVLFKLKISLETESCRQPRSILLLEAANDFFSYEPVLKALKDTDESRLPFPHLLKLSADQEVRDDPISTLAP